MMNKEEIYSKYENKLIIIDDLVDYGIERIYRYKPYVPVLVRRLLKEISIEIPVEILEKYAKEIEKSENYNSEETVIEFIKWLRKYYDYVPILDWDEYFKLEKELNAIGVDLKQTAIDWIKDFCDEELTDI